MSDIVTIGEVTTTVVSYKNQRVCTSKQLAQLYGCEEKNLNDNHSNNRKRFEEGKHFVKLEGEALRSFKQGIPDEIGDPLKFAARLILWTDRGAARHAKMLETDAAWDVFEQLEDCYFAPAKTRHVATGGSDRSTPQDRLPLYLFAAEAVIKHRLMFNKVYVFMNLFAGTHRFKDMSKEQSAEVHDFCDRFMDGNDTRNDWQRITDNQAKLHGTPPQLDMVQKLLLS